MRTLLFTISLLATTCLTVNAEDLNGKVTNSNGDPISGALVAMCTARPRVGPGVL